MLNHPWLNMPANYECKYSDKEYEIMLLKKDLKNKVKRNNEGIEDDPQEMNELIESEQERNAADLDLNLSYIEGEDYDPDEGSFMESDE